MSWVQNNVRTNYESPRLAEFSRFQPFAEGPPPTPQQVLLQSHSLPGSITCQQPQGTGQPLTARRVQGPLPPSPPSDGVSAPSLTDGFLTVLTWDSWPIGSTRGYPGVLSALNLHISPLASSTFMLVLFSFFQAWQTITVMIL